MASDVSAFERHCVKHVLRRLQSYLLSDFFSILQDNGQHSKVLNKFKESVLDTSVLTTFLMKLLPCENELKSDLNKKKKSLREYAKAFDLPLGLRVSMVNKCFELVSAWQAWSVVDGGLVPCVSNEDGGSPTLELCPSASTVILGECLSSPHPHGNEGEGGGGYYDVLEKYEVYSPLWSSRPLVMLVHNPHGHFSPPSTDNLGRETQSSSSFSPTSMSVESFLRFSLHWIKCSEQQHSHLRYFQQGHQVQQAYFVRFIKQCWCLVIAPEDNTAASSLIHSVPVPRNNLVNIPMQVQYRTLMRQHKPKETCEFTVTLSLEDFLTQGTKSTPVMLCDKLMLFVSISDNTLYTTLLCSYF
jgi:hypothetical protein